MHLSMVTSSSYIKGSVPLEYPEVKCLDQEHSGEHDLFNISLDLILLHHNTPPTQQWLWVSTSVYFYCQFYETLNGWRIYKGNWDEGNYLHTKYNYVFMRKRNWNGHIMTNAFQNVLYYKIYM